MLADSNLIIYGARPENQFLRDWFKSEAPSVSGVSYVEALGYHGLTQPDREFFESFFAVARVLPIDASVLDQAVKLRQTRKMSLGDSLVAGSAMANGLTLATRNVRDFTWIPDFPLFNPFDQPSALGTTQT